MSRHYYATIATDRQFKSTTHGQRIPFEQSHGLGSPPELIASPPKKEQKTKQRVRLRGGSVEREPRDWRLRALAPQFGVTGGTIHG